MDLWPLAVAGVALVSALVFGFHARRAQARIGELKEELEGCEARVRDQAELLELLAEPDPTLEQLRKASAAAVAAARGGVPSVES